MQPHDFGVGTVLAVAASAMFAARMIQGYRAWRHRKARERARGQPRKLE